MTACSKPIPNEWATRLADPETRGVELKKIQKEISDRRKGLIKSLAANPSTEGLVAQAMAPPQTTNPENVAKKDGNPIIGRLASKEVRAELAQNNGVDKPAPKSIAEHGSEILGQLKKITTESIQNTVARLETKWNKALAAYAEAPTKENFKNGRDAAQDIFKNFSKAQKSKLKAATKDRPELTLFTDTLGTYLNLTTGDPNAQAKVVDGFLDRLAEGENPNTLTQEALQMALEQYTEKGITSESIFLADKLDERTYTRSTKTKEGDSLSNLIKDNMPVPSLESVSKTKHKDPLSLLAALPDVHEYLSRPEFRNQILSGVDSFNNQSLHGLVSFLSLRNDVAQTLENEVLEDAHSSDGLMHAHGKIVGERFSKAPLHYLRENDGRMNSNVATAVALEITSFVGSRGRDTLYNDDAAIEQILGVTNSRGVPLVVHEALVNNGTLRNPAMQRWGQNVLNQLNIVVDSEGADGFFQDRLKTSLGELVLAVGDKLDLFGPTKDIPATDMAKWKGLVEGNKDLDLDFFEDRPPSPFIKINTDPKDITEPAENVQGVIDTFQDTKKLFSDLFDLQDDGRKLLEEPVKVNRKIQGSVNEVSDGLAEANAGLQENPIVANMDMKALLARLPEQAVKEMMGWKDPATVHVTAEKSQAGINRGINRSFEALNGVYGKIDKEGNNPIYLELSTKQNLRSMLQNALINYQGSKVHRWAFGMPEWDESLELNDTTSLAYQAFRAGVGAGLGVKIDKNRWKQTLAESEAKLQEPEIRAAIDAIKAGSPEGVEAIAAGVKAGGEKMHSLAVLEAQARYEQFQEAGDPKQTFTHSVAIEVDGLTNGLSISAFQLPLMAVSKIKNILRKTGVFFKGEPQSYAEATERGKKGLADEDGGVTTDNYEDLIGGMNAEINSMEQGGYIEKAKDEQIAKFKAGYAKSPELSWYKQSQLLEQILSVTPLKALMPKFEKETGEVTKEGRNLGKDPVMQGNYGAQKKSIGFIFAEAPVEYTYDRLMEIGADPELNDYNKAIQLKSLIDSLWQATRSYKGDAQTFDYAAAIGDKAKAKAGKDRPQDFRVSGQEILDYSGGPAEFARTFILPLVAEDTLRERANAVFGEAGWTAINEQLELAHPDRKTINDSVVIMNEIYSALFEARVKKFSAENDGRVPTEADERAIKEDLRDAGLLPSIRHPGTKDPNDFLHMLEITNSDPTVVDDAEGLNEAQLFTAEELRNGKGSISAKIQRRRPNAEVGVKALARIIQSLDGWVIGQVYKGQKVYHVFDAYISKASEAISTGVVANQAFVDTMRDYSMVDAIKERVDFFAEAVKEPEIAAELDSVDFVSILTDYDIAVITNNTLTNEETKTDVIDFLQKEMATIAEQVAEKRTEIFSELGAVGQFSIEGGSAIVNDSLGSSADTLSRRDYAEVYRNSLNVDSATQLLKDIEALETVEIDSDHNAQLDRVANDIILPGLAQVDQFQQILAKNPDASLNAGEVKGNEVFIGAAGNKLSSPIDMSLKETAIHEYSHVVLRDYLDDPKNYKDHKRLSQLFEKAKQDITPTDFLPEGRNTQIERDRAQDRYDYIFNNPNGAHLHEFAAIGLTNKQFAEALSRIDDKPPVGSDSVWSSNPIQTLLNIISAAVNMLTGKVHDFTRKGNVQEGLHSLAKEIVTVNAQQQQNVVSRTDGLATSLGDKANKAVKKAQWKLFNKTREWAYGAPPVSDDIAEVHAKLTVAGLNKVITQGKDMMQANLKALGVGKTDVANNIVQEIAGLNERDRNVWRGLKRVVNNNIDNPRKRIADAVSAQVKSFFDPETKITKKDWQAINDTVMRTDLTSLVGLYNLEEISNLLSNETYLDEQTNALKATIRNKFGKNGMAYINQANSLGMLITKGTTPDEIANPMQNAYAIANLFFLDESKREVVGDLSEAEQLIDQLATLQALRNTDPVLKDRTARIVESERSREVNSNGIEMLMSSHAAFKEESLAKLFDGNKISTWKGYTSENLASNVQIKVDSKDPATEREMAKRGYYPVSQLEKDPLDPDKTEQWMYVSDLGLDTYQSSIVSLSNLQHAGSALEKTFQNNMNQPGNASANNIAALGYKNYNLARNQLQREMKPYSSGAKLVPILSPTNGKVVGYRYMMQTATKDKYMQRDDRAPEVLGNMFGSIPNREGTKTINRATVDGLYKDFQDFGTDPNTTFVYLSPTAATLELKEAYDMLPDDMKIYAEKTFGSKGIPIRKNMYNYILGFRQKSITGSVVRKAAKHDIKMPKNVLQGIDIADRIWKEVVGHARAKISILLPEVVAGNMISNVMLLAADGIPPTFIAKSAAEGGRAMRKYQKQRVEADKLGVQIAALTQQGKDTKGLVGRQSYLENQMRMNPVNELVQEGMFTAIVEDVDPAGLASGRNKVLGKTFEKIAERAEEHGFGNVVEYSREGLMMPGSVLFSKVVAANQYGDFIGRYTKFKYDTQVRKVDRQTAIDDALDSFIYYDEPSDPWLQAANDYGFVMFSKFYLRVQRVFAKLLAKKPATAMSAALINNMIGAEGVEDYFMDTSKMMGRLHIAPPGNVQEVFSLPTMSWLGYPFSGNYY